jgi:hypothetical protein
MEKLNYKLLLNKKFFLSLFFSWLIFIAIDFVFHASLLKNLWIVEANNLKPKEELFKYIPEGYLSFLILSFLVVVVYKILYHSDPGLKKTFIYGCVAGFLFSLSQLLALHSFVLLSFYFLLIVYLVYWVEIVSVALIFRYVYYRKMNLKVIFNIILLFFILLIAGIVLQNVI